MKTITKTFFSLFTAMIAFGFTNAQTVVTIAEFLAASESESVYYELTGTISNITNTTYGNFDLVDETGSVYVYGLTATKKTSNDKSFASIGLVEGDIITIHGTRAAYDGTPQVGGPAYFVSKVELPSLTTPVATEATNITADGFTANWEAVDDATSYTLDVWNNVETEVAVANNSFENGTDGWYLEDAYSISTDNAHTGTNAVAFTATATKDLRQTVNYVVPGREITVSYWYYLDASSTGNGTRLWCSWEGSDDKSLQPASDYYANKKGAWTQESMTTTVPEGATALKLEIRVYKNSSGYIDDVTVTHEGMGIMKNAAEGAPFTVTETSKAITGLTPGTTYYYNVVANAEGYESSEISNTITATTNTSSGLSENTIDNIRFDGQTIYNPAKVNLMVYNLTGALVASGNGNIDMANEAAGVYIVRTQNATLKIVKQ